MSEVFMTFLRLGLTSFGGPVAHIGYFRQEFVEKRRWISSNAYADLVALCQFLAPQAVRLEWPLDSCAQALKDLLPPG